MLPLPLVQSTLAPFVRLLSSTSRVVHTYAAHGIERLLSLRRPADGTPVKDASQTSHMYVQRGERERESARCFCCLDILWDVCFVEKVIFDQF